jgi:hypothetical protein
MPTPALPSTPLVATPPYAVTGTRLGRAVLALMVGVVLVITLAPFVFRWPGAAHVTFWASDGPWHGWFDVVANVALFTPLGFIAALTRAVGRPGPVAAGAPAPSRLALVRAFASPAVAGAAVSVLIELVQCFEPGRYPSPTDVCSNTLGAWAGAALYRRLAARLGVDSPVVGRLALELPVVGLVYLVLPLLTLAGTTAGAGPVTAVVAWPPQLGGAGAMWAPDAVLAGAVEPRALALVALAAFGGTLLGTVQRRHLGPQGLTRARATAGLAALWFGAGALPAALTSPRAYLAGVVAAAGAAWAVGRGARTGVRAVERRFEGEALARGAPWLAAYLLLLPLGDTAGPFGRLSILRDLEEATAFATLGYVLAEASGRREWRAREAAWRVALAAAALSGAVLAARAVMGAGGGAASPALAVAVRTGVAVYGAALYHLQRAHVRALVAARAGRAAAPTAVPEPTRLPSRRAAA